MSTASLKNIPASVSAKLHNLAQKEKLDYGYVFFRYANERFLYRMSISKYSEKFVLKGSNLFLIWQNGYSYRPTMDADLLCFGAFDEDLLRRVFSDICHQQISRDDGMHYDSASIAFEEIRKATEYGGITVSFDAYLGTAKHRLQFDIGVGDAITPEPESKSFPVLLDGDAPLLKVYPKLTVIAEKTEAMVRLGELNSRMKDFADLWVLQSSFSYQFSELEKAIENTFERRKTEITEKLPVCFSDGFANSPDKKIQWKAFLRKNSLKNLPVEFSEVAVQITVFLKPFFEKDSGKYQEWKPGTGWI